MPELPEVEITKQGMMPLLGQQVRHVVTRTFALRWPIPAHLGQTLADQKLQKLTRRAKYILAEFETGVLIFHLGMSGRISLLPDEMPAEKHDHFDVVFYNNQLLRLHDPRRFGAVLWSENPLKHPLLINLGVEPLDDCFDAGYLHQKLHHKKAAIKTIIMDSHLVVGVGNIYASESLFRARISPQMHARDLSLQQCDQLVKAIKATLIDALKAGGSSLRDFFGADGSPGYFQQEYFVYGRTRQPCKICEAVITHIRQGQRSTFYCPNCQPSN